MLVRIQTISIVSLAVVISFAAYWIYSIHNPQVDLEKTEKMQELVSLQIKNCMKENQTMEFCYASLEEFIELAKLELDK